MSRSFERFAAAQKELLLAGKEVSDALFDFYDSPSPMRHIAEMMKESYTYMSTEVCMYMMMMVLIHI